MLLAFQITDDLSFCVVLPRSNSMWYTLPSRDTSTLNHSRKRVHALRADAVRAAGKLVAALTIFAAGVQVRQHHLHAGILNFGWMSTGMPRPLSRIELEPST